MDTRKVETHALSDDQLDTVSGGCIIPLGLVNAIKQVAETVGAGGGGGGSCSGHDPASCFQAILDQLTHG